MGYGAAKGGDVSGATEVAKDAAVGNGDQHMAETPSSTSGLVVQQEAAPQASLTLETAGNSSSPGTTGGGAGSSMGTTVPASPGTPDGGAVSSV